MNQYTVTFENGTIRDIPGTDLEDARRYAESCGPVASITAKTPPKPKPTYDFDRTGLGIGGLGRYVEEPIVPTVAQMERLERLEARATTCRRCGQSDVFDGAMFTTLRGGDICDDCCG